MEPMQYAATLAQFEQATAFSALPDAPVVEAAERRHVVAASRLRLARTLHRLGDRVAPAHAPRRAYAGGR